MLFMVGDHVLRQVQGAFIGSPISPPWCLLTVGMTEYDWNTFLRLPYVRGADWTAVRYADNRFMLGLSTHSFLCVPCGLLDPTFYGDSIVLEPEADDQQFVGSKIVVERGCISASMIT